MINELILIIALLCSTHSFSFAGQSGGCKIEFVSINSIAIYNATHSPHKHIITVKKNTDSNNIISISVEAHNGSR